MGNSLAARFAVIYTLLALVVPLSAFATYKEVEAPKISSPKTIVHKVDLGITSAGVAAEKEVQSVAGQNGLLVRSQKVLSVKQTPTGATVLIKAVVLDPFGKKHTVKLEVTLQKSLYQPQGVQPVA